MMKSVFLSSTTSGSAAATSTDTACNASMTTNKNTMRMKKSLFLIVSSWIVLMTLLSLLMDTSTIIPTVYATVSKQKVDQYSSRKQVTTTVSTKIKNDNDKQTSFSYRSSLINIPRGGGRLLQKRSVTTTTITKSTNTTSNNKLLHTIKVGWYFTLWYTLNVWYNIINKQLLNKVPASIMIGTIQLGIGSIYVLVLWLLRLRPKPVIGTNDCSIKSYWYVGIMHSIGQLSSMVSLMSGTVSFTHIVKALEPFFSSIVSILVYKVIMPYPVYLTLVPVVCGVSYACMSDTSFSYISLYAAMISNVAFAFRAVLSKVVMTNNDNNNQISTTKPLQLTDRNHNKKIRNKNTGKQQTQTNIIVSQNLTPVNVFGLVTIISFIVSIPIAIVWEGKHFIKVWNNAISSTTQLKTITNSNVLKQQLLISGIVHYINNEVMYMTLSNVHPITLAVGNTIKRIVIIIASVIAFGTDISTQTLIGSSIGLSGVLLYSLTKQYYEKLELVQQQQPSKIEVVTKKADNNKNKKQQQQHNQRHKKQSLNNNNNKLDNNRKGTRVISRK